MDNYVYFVSCLLDKMHIIALIFSKAGVFVYC